jgi:Bacterial protein of unknown function (DUF839)
MQTYRRAVAVLAGGLVVLALATLSAIAVAAPGGSTGPSSSESPYLVRSRPGVVLKSILTVGDAAPKVGGGSYRLVGKPDGLGAFDNGDGTFTVLMNHELAAGTGAVRAHGARGAFVSKWTIRKDDLSVVSAEDLIREVATWNPSTSTYNPPAAGIGLRLLCSATLPPVSALYNAESGNGFDGRIFMNGEEVDNAGRAFGHLLDGTTYELPALGRAGWENQVANAYTGDKTVVVGLDDSGELGQVYVYVGDKRTEGNPVERAGLTGGTLYGIKVSGFVREDQASAGFSFPAEFTGFSLGDVSSLTGAQLNSASNAVDITRFSRPEDGVWDPNSANDFYFATTATFAGKSRLWQLHFNDPADPAQGGTISMLLEGDETGGTAEQYHQLDNMTANDRGELILQEDPGGQAYLARVWKYVLADDELVPLAKADPSRFKPPTPEPFTQAEESSGVIEVSDILGEGWYLLDVMAHYNQSDPELVQGGQLLAMHIPPLDPFP